MPAFSIFRFGGLDSIGFLIFLSFIAYAITKHHLFNVKVIVTELLVFTVWVFLLIKTLLEKTWQERIVDGTFLALVIFFGILIIKSVIREVEQKDRFKDLSEKLDKLNTQLTTKTTYLTALQYFTADITQSLDYKTIIQKIVDEISTRLGYVAALLILVSDDTKKGYLAAISSNKATRIGLGLLPRPAEEYYSDMNKEEDRNLVVDVIKTGNVKISDKLSDFLSPPVPKIAIDLIQKTLGFKSVAGVPIKSENKILGTIEIILNKPREEISHDELEMIQALANQVGIVLKNASLYKKLGETNEKLVELDKLKSGMYSFVSHQIKAPIGIIKGFSQLIYDGSYGAIPAKVKERVGDIKKSCDRLIQLVEDFLNLRRIEEGKMEYEFMETDLVNLIKSVFDELKLLAEQKKLKFSFECKEKEIKTKIDEQRLRQVIVNLIENAIKYTEKGFVKVSIKYQESPRQNKFGTGQASIKDREVLFSVSDSGIGILPEVLPEIFDQFKRAKEAKNIKGTGLGLYIAREIVKAHNGEIWAESKGEGKGSRFWVRLKVEK